MLVSRVPSTERKSAYWALDSLVGGVATSTRLGIDVAKTQVGRGASRGWFTIEPKLGRPTLWYAGGEKPFKLAELDESVQSYTFDSIRPRLWIGRRSTRVDVLDLEWLTEQARSGGSWDETVQMYERAVGRAVKLPRPVGDVDGP